MTPTQNAKVLGLTLEPVGSALRQFKGNGTLRGLARERGLHCGT